MKKIRLLLLLALSIGMLSAQVSQSLAGVDSLKIGSRFQFIIETDFPLKEIEIPDSLEGFKVIAQSISPQSSGSIARLSIVPLRVGALSFPKLKLKNARLLGGDMETDAFRVYVLRSRAEGDSLLRDIKPLRRYPMQMPFWLYPVLIILLILLLILLLLSFRRKKVVKPAIPNAKAEPIPQPDPAQKALQQLADLRQSGMLYRDLLGYHFRLSMILREFLEEFYGFGAIQMTSQEIAEQLLMLRPRHTEDYLRILRFCDMVKFAGLQPDIEDVLLHSDTLRTCLQSPEENNV